MRRPVWVLLAVLVGSSCESRLPLGAAGEDPESVAGIYVLATVDARTLPVQSYAGCTSFPSGQRPLCGIASGRLTLMTRGGFRLSLVTITPGERPEIIKGGYTTNGRNVIYQSAAHGEFHGLMLPGRACAEGPGVTFERAVELFFCIDPASLASSP